ncbi:protein kinase [Rhodococcus sp. USK10]|uniref:protein kinase domain-containing protein n=1 Tax=Rhodococcus sp. USK10 TaxID=2789739 RepID=UPI001C5D2D2C|nr:protein kinase [Rhodococcus sp. USK10]QYB07718.1 protein kinase [Rhodococcus sp. USK10]
MADIDPLRTQRALDTSDVSELATVGLSDIVEIGRGGFGIVYRCMQEELDRTVAVKVLTGDLSEENCARFLREQRAMGRLTGHPNIVNVLQVGITGSGRPYLMMPYYPHGSLETWIRRHGPLSVDEVLQLGVKLSGAVESAHQLDILHRDLKPANILLTDYGEPALTDFGIARVAGAFETATGAVTGSPAFTAPEVLKGDRPTSRADVYGLGATLFCALTGHAAFERRSGEQVVAQFLRITSQPAPDLREEGIPDDVAATIGRAMSADPRDRYPTAAVFGEELRSIQNRRRLPLDEMALRTDPGGTRAGRTQRERSASKPVGGGQTRNRPAPKASGNLPVELTSFVGRRTELTEIKQLLSVSHLVTLTGMGGVGKTRLALRVAEKVKRNFADGVWLVELGELRDDSLLIGSIAGALRLRDRSGRPLLEVVSEYIAARELLLVLDNCEQVVDAVAELSEKLLRVSPRLRILATSREALGILGEATVRVRPLAVPDPDRGPSSQEMPNYDAVTLFVERATSALPTFGLTESNRDVVARICRHLDGLPLPIELAAARLHALSPEQILQRLTDRYALLTSGNRGAPTRQQTLRSCVDWSHDLCAPQEQLLWARLTVFVGSFDLAAAENICGFDMTPAGFLDAVMSLVDKSILIRDDAQEDVRFRMLETLHQYGREKAQRSGELELLQRRHRDWYVRLALDAEASWIKSDQLPWIARLDREQSNLRAALEFCIAENDPEGLRFAAALYALWGGIGLYTEGRRWLDRILSSTSGQPTVDRVKALYIDSFLADMQGDLSAGRALVEDAYLLAGQDTEPESRMYATHADGLLAFFSGELARACSLLSESAEAARESGLAGLQVEALTMMGLPYELLGDHQRSIDCYEQVFSITEPGESVYRSYSLWAMAITLWRQGESERPAALLAEGIVQLGRLVHDPVGTAMCLEALAWIAGTNGQTQRAVVLMGAAEKIGDTVGSSPSYLPNLLVHHEECVQNAREQLGDRAFAEAHSEGQSFGLEGAVAYALGEHQPQEQRPPGHKLTKREIQVADLVAEGLTNRAIATRLVISPRTAQGHVEHLLTKLGFTSRAQIAAWVVAHRDERGTP